MMEYMLSTFTCAQVLEKGTFDSGNATYKIHVEKNGEWPPRLCCGFFRRFGKAGGLAFAIFNFLFKIVRFIDSF